MVLMVMNDKERVLELINGKVENDLCDFKLEYYSSHKKYEVIKDILSFANSPISGDKYIIFNVDNDTRETGSLNKSSIPDVSEIDSLLREYCEPYIQIELNGFYNNRKYIAYIKIKSSNTDKPYIIKKDYHKGGKIYLSQGQIYIRRNSNNYKANRRDLDEIYESREKRKISLVDDKIVVAEIMINKVKYTLHYLRFVLENKSKFNFSICKSEIEIHFEKNGFNLYGKYIEDLNTIFSQPLNDIGQVPFQIDANAVVQKTLYFSVTEQCTKLLQKMKQDENELFIKIRMIDISGKKVETELIKCELEYKRV